MKKQLFLIIEEYYESIRKTEESYAKTNDHMRKEYDREFNKRPMIPGSRAIPLYNPPQIHTLGPSFEGFYSWLKENQ